MSDIGGRGGDRGERGRSGRKERRDRCRPHFGDIDERVEILKRVPHDDAEEVLKTIIEAAFYAGVACGCCECGCHREEREEDDKPRRRRDD